MNAPHTSGAAALPLFLVGLPGSGKSRVGRMLARELHVPHVDTDDLIEAREGQSIAQIFESHGEAYFRRVEAEVIAESAAQPAVVSLGGGAVETASVRSILSRGNTAWIRAPKDELLRRIRRSSRRPLMRQNPERKLDELASRREPLYARVANIQAWTSAGPPQDVAAQVRSQMVSQAIVEVQGQSPYPVFVAAGAAKRIPSLIPGDATRVFLVHPTGLEFIAEPIATAVRQAGAEVISFAHPQGEAGKTYAVAEQGWDAMGEARIGRRDVVLSVGGGATTDLGGFLAATWLRGVRNINVATTVLGMVDAAVGGKTGINTPGGKNLVGSFYDPTAVVCDIDFISTLPQADYAAGLAEAIKCGFIADPVILDLFEANPELGERDWAVTEGRTVLTEVIERAVRVKADVVGQDRTESNLREILNYGHTLGHAIEREEDYEARHGEAVAIGCVFAAELAESLGLLTEEEVQRHRSAFAAIGLPTSYDGSLARLVGHMRLDKKVRADELRFVLLWGIGKPDALKVKPGQLAEAARRIGLSE